MWRALIEYIIYQSILLGFLGSHEIIPLSVRLDFLQCLPGMPGEYLIQAFARFQYLTRVDVDIRCLALKAAERLMNHEARVR